MKPEKKKSMLSWMRKYFGTTEATVPRSTKKDQLRKSNSYLPPILAPDNTHVQQTYQSTSFSKASSSNMTSSKSKTSSKSLVFREKPPRMPLPIPQQTITIPGKLLAPPPREIIVEQEEYDDEDEGPQEIIIERWLAYPKQQRKVIFESANGDGSQLQMVTTADDDTLKSHLKRLGMSEADLQKIDWDSFDSNSNLDPQTKRNIIYQSAPSIQPVITPANIFIDWEFDSTPPANTNYADERATLTSSDTRSNFTNKSDGSSKISYENNFARSVSNLQGANVRFLGVEEADPFEYVRQHSNELIDSAKLPEYFRSIQVPASIVGEQVELAADRSNRCSFDFTGDVDALNLVSDKNLYKF